jgi:hypothetical protein
LNKTEIFIDKVRKIHGNKYNYNKTIYKNNNLKVIITCPTHGDFEQLARSHLSGHGCRKCSHRIIDFIERCKKVHNNKYDYSKTIYTKSSEKVIITCPVHGDFKQFAGNHLSGRECALCASRFKHDINTFINKANKIHNNKYNYSEVSFNTTKDKIKIICPTHGAYYQSARKHLEGSGCYKCAGNIKYTNEEFIIKAKKVHGDKYNYSKVNFTGSHNKVTIVCQVHGDFEQVPSNHLRGFGCKKCYLDNAHFNSNNRHSTKEFIEISNKIHHGFYNYDKVDYYNNLTKVIITCPVHGDFKQAPSNHFNGFGCQKCSEIISSKHKEILNFLDSHDIKYKINDRKIIKPYEVDIYIPEKKLAIEYHGLYWHSIKGNRYIHRNKYTKSIDININLIQVFENEWLKHKDIVKSIILDNLGLLNENISNNIKEISNKEYNQFCLNNDIKGIGFAKIKIGLFYNNELVEVIGLNKHYKYSYELIRLCCKLNCKLNGSKLLEYFINKYKPISILFYCNARYQYNYKSLGFELINHIKPKFYYTKGVKLFNKKQNKCHKIWDAGKLLYIRNCK